MALFNVLVLFFSFIPGLSGNDIDCPTKVKELNSFILSRANTTKWSNKDLIKIVIPEYISYDPLQDEFEKYLIKFLYSVNNTGFKKISFGPFQMQPEFILKYSDNMSYPEIIQSIDSLSTVNSQYQILLQFVQKNSSCTVSELINLYNSGDINWELKYKKINNKMTYNEYANLLIKNCY